MLEPAGVGGRNEAGMYQDFINYHTGITGPPLIGILGVGAEVPGEEAKLIIMIVDHVLVSGILSSSALV